MPKGTNQKFKLYRLAQIMQEKTDDTPESAEQYMETEDKVVKCPQCGAEIEANAKFCKFCGFKQW